MFCALQVEPPPPPLPAQQRPHFDFVSQASSDGDAGSLEGPAGGPRVEDEREETIAQRTLHQRRSVDKSFHLA